ncbi:Bcr/CflA family multidrug resistance transporter [Proteus myxofaciens ATCC 19692]|uniref:Bcr/CflA family efflux transporter n=2 Tax=Proteus myxofaciens TaxID=184072 RepID=A0A198GQ27_9GAMM|nr:Bcr/CflA family multidrug resistance transporter [Proteus myxofaciens ATCC 19692]
MQAIKNSSGTFSSLLVILLALITALDAMAIDLYLPAMPTIANDIHVSSVDIQLTLSVFLVGLAIGQGIYGPLLDRYGRRIPLLVGIGIFSLGSFIATITQNLEWLLIARLIQAIGASAGLVTPRAIVDDSCSLKESSKIFSLLMQIMMIAPILAPIIGGFLLSHIGWRSIFGFMTLLGIIIFIWGYRSIPDTLPIEHRTPLSIKNSIRAYLTQLGNTVYMGYTLAGGVILASLFVYISGSSFIFTAHYGLTPTQFSYIFAANAIALIIGGQIDIFLQKRYISSKIIIILGIVIHTAVGITLLTVINIGNVSLITFGSLLAIGVGALGLIFGNLTALTMASVKSQSGVASSLMGMLQYFISAVIGFLISLISSAMYQLPFAFFICGLLAMLFLSISLFKLKKNNLNK